MCAVLAVAMGKTIYKVVRLGVSSSRPAPVTRYIEARWPLAIHLASALFILCRQRNRQAAAAAAVAEEEELANVAGIPAARRKREDERST